MTYIRSRGRLDIKFAAAKVARLTEYPHKKVFEWAERIVKYLEQHKHNKLVLKKHVQDVPTLTMISDASVATEYDYKSRIEVHIWYGNNLILS